MRKDQDKGLLQTIMKFMIVPTIILAIFMLVWLKSEITSLEYRISNYERVKLDLLKKKKELVVVRSDMLSIKNIEKTAMGELGLTFPDRKKVYYVKRGDGPFHYKAHFDSSSE